VEEQTSNQVRHYLKDNRATIDLVPSFEKVNRDQLLSQISTLSGNDKIREQTKAALQYLDFEDAQLDGFIDKDEKLHGFLIQKINPLQETKEQGITLSLDMQEWLRDINKQLKSDVVKKVSSDFRKSPAMSYYKYQYVFNEGHPRNEFYLTTYYVASKVKSYLVTEVHQKDQSIEKSIRTLSNGS